MNQSSHSPVQVKEQDFVAEALERCTLFLQAYSCEDILAYLSFSQIRFVRYKRAERLFYACMLVLWYYALCRSFPSSAKAMLETFIQEHLPELYSQKHSEEITKNVQILLEKMQEKGDTDFTVMAQYIFTTFDLSSRKLAKNQQLKLVLYFRTQYAALYEGLI